MGSLQTYLLQWLDKRQARKNKNDICEVKGELYDQCFDEIIRQVTINEPDRGLLLMWVKTEIQHTIQSYYTMYKSAVTFSQWKMMHADHGMPELESWLSELTDRR